MTEQGRVGVARASALLLAAALLRGLVAPPPASVPLGGRRGSGDSLEVLGDSLARDNEARSRPMGAGERIDVNRASAAELDRLPGIGPARAARIVADREINGPYAVSQDLTRVPGLGEASVRRLEPFLTFPSPPSTPRPTLTKEGPGARRLLGVVERPSPAPALPAVRLNGATREELESLPGIGPVLARRIVEHRSRIGGFRRIDDLVAVPGLGAKTVERLRPLVAVR